MSGETKGSDEGMRKGSREIKLNEKQAAEREGMKQKEKEGKRVKSLMTSSAVEETVWYGK